MAERTLRFKTMGVLALACLGLGGLHAAGCSNTATSGSGQCSGNGDCSAAEVCCDGTCETASQCACVTDDECAPQPDSGPGAWICCGSAGEGGAPTGRCTRPAACNAAICPMGSGCSVPGGTCAGTNRICETVSSGGQVIDCTCQCRRGAAGAECDGTGGCNAPRSCNTGTCACECDRAEGAECDAFGGCGSGQTCNIDRCRCEAGAEGGTPVPDGGDSGTGSQDSSVGVDSRAVEASAGGDSGDASRRDGGAREDAATSDATRAPPEGGVSNEGGDSDASSSGDASDGSASGNEGSPCNDTSDCNDICVTGNGSPPATHVYSQVCQGGVCTRYGRVETCDNTCNDNKVMSRICVAGVCQLAEEVEDCEAKLYGAGDETGCYQCEDNGTAACVLNSVNGGWEPWRVSTPSDDTTKNGDCAVADDGRVWHTHYCNEPAPRCGGIWCYWTTGAPGGPSATTQPEFSCRKPDTADGGTP